MGLHHDHKGLGWLVLVSRGEPLHVGEAGGTKHPFLCQPDFCIDNVFVVLKIEGKKNSGNIHPSPSPHPTVFSSDPLVGAPGSSGLKPIGMWYVASRAAVLCGTVRCCVRCCSFDLLFSSPKANLSVPILQPRTR